jgi:hypothetical protein
MVGFYLRDNNKAKPVPFFVCTKGAHECVTASFSDLLRKSLQLRFAAFSYQKLTFTIPELITT